MPTYKRTLKHRLIMSKLQKSAWEKKQPGYSNRNKTTKICPKCGIRRYRKSFSKDVARADGLNGWCKKCMKSISKKYLPRKRKQSREERIVLRLQVLTHYSGGAPDCACCKIKILEFLSIDHIHGGGSKHKRLVRNVYRWLRINKFPRGFRVLCHNCNQSLGAYGYCPHDI